MALQDIFVGVVAIGIGLFALFSAACNWDWSYRLWKARYMEARFGRRGARIFYAMLGAAMIALGVAIALGFGPNRARAKMHAPSRFAEFRDFGRIDLSEIHSEQLKSETIRE